MGENKYQIAIIGSGPGGYVAALRAGYYGKKTVLIEKEMLGGTCLNWGCIPTKAFVRSAELFSDIKNAKSFGLEVENAEVNFPAVVKRKDQIVKRLVGGIDYLLKQNNVVKLEGRASFIDSKKLKIENEDKTEEIEAENIIIATGSKAAELPIPGADLDGILDSREVLDLKELPESMVIIGGGIIGMEFAFIFSSFGVEVTVVEYLEQLVSGVDSEIAKELLRSAKRRKINVKTSSEVKEIKNSSDGYEVIYLNKDKEKSVKAEKILMAVGRKPYHQGLNLENAGVEITERRKAVKVNKKMQTNVDGIYAVGDVTDKVLLAHVASHQGVIAVENIMGKDKKMSYHAVPGAIFSSPEIGTVGLSEDEAKEQGIDYKVGSFPFAANGKVLAMGERNGKVKIIAEKGSNKIIGAAVIGLAASDLIAELTLAVNLGLTADQLAETIHAHPTTAETIHEAALDLTSSAIHFSS
ncbi:MAG: dihydrolipoamide dehydrogenase [Halanaerobium sp. 4-GBenrich]|jgi:dihydrolipoamide dehydrogenase|uniref:Dihydrolipoyl dehydrogenase n=1 Tax=Halanaerobium congolense TaxID=54121 RepID=A0A4R8GND2_9FIRM|nr:dihydrolipoyl dehydrogenase [Halanaerobium congolense]ODS50113.1 MAG: dihydrolipoamide dehydrogenase [Halanaerobium sp. 4-GBenrich]TDX43097.1 dihydrolipoamide dehydrogenase [Halanaerobium congolense]